MSMNAYPMYECVLEESKIEELVPKEFKRLKDKLTSLGISFDVIATAERYEDDEPYKDNIDIQLAVQEYPDIENYETAVNVAISEITLLYERLTGVFRHKYNLYLFLLEPNSDASIDMDSDYMWGVELKFNRVLQDMNPRIISWVEYG